MVTFFFLLQSENGDTSRQGILKRSGSTYSIQSNSTPPSSTEELKMSKGKVCVCVCVCARICVCVCV